MGKRLTEKLEGEKKPEGGTAERKKLHLPTLVFCVSKRSLEIAYKRKRRQKRIRGKKEWFYSGKKKKHLL